MPARLHQFFTSSPAITIFIFSQLIALLCVCTVSAQTWFIKPSAEIPLRRGQGTDYRILAIVPDGTAVSILEEDDSWAKVTTSDGKEGWILKRYLSEEPPLDSVVENLQKKNVGMQERITALEAENEEYKTFNTALKNSLEKAQRDLESTTITYQKLVEETSDVMAIKNSLDRSRTTITRLQQELATVTAKNQELSSTQNIKWFLAGGGTLIFGCLVGMISARSRKKKPSLY